jgi:hypothetical protein
MKRRFLTLFLFIAALAPSADAQAPATPPPGVEAPAIPVERSPAIIGQGYFPVAQQLRDGRIAVIMRGGAGHLGIKGRLDMIFSSDEGKTWSAPVVVNDSPIDDRNPAIGEASDGTLVVGFWRTATYTDEDRYDPKLIEKERSTWVTRSKDGGRTWSDPAPIDTADIGLGSPFGRMLTLPDDSMLMAIYGFQIRQPGETPTPERQHSYVYRSTDHGQSWSRLAEIGDGKQQLSETSLVRLPDGRIRAAIRSRATDLWLSESKDNGRTWSQTQPFAPANIHPADQCLLPDGRVLITMGNRTNPYGVLGVVSDAAGNLDWAKRFALVTDAQGADCGYPSSIALKNGRVLTLYYATRVKNEPAWKVHCGALTYEVPK